MLTYVPDGLFEKTFQIEHCPNCPKSFLIRFCGAGVIDKKPVRESKDIYGYGNTIAEAIQDAKTRFPKLKL